jgi:hypothetical protein
MNKKLEDEKNIHRAIAINESRQASIAILKAKNACKVQQDDIKKTIIKSGNDITNYKEEIQVMNDALKTKI